MKLPECEPLRIWWVLVQNLGPGPGPTLAKAGARWMQSTCQTKWNQIQSPRVPKGPQGSPRAPICQLDRPRFCLQSIHRCSFPRIMFTFSASISWKIYVYIVLCNCLWFSKHEHVIMRQWKNLWNFATLSWQFCLVPGERSSRKQGKQGSHGHRTPAERHSTATPHGRHGLDLHSPRRVKVHHRTDEKLISEQISI